MSADLRWHQRFENLQRALKQLQAAITAHDAKPYDQARAQQAAALICERYWPELQGLHNSLEERVRQEAKP